MEHPFAASTIQETPDDDNASTIPLEAHNNAPTSRHLEPVAQGPSRQVVHNARHLREAGGTHISGVFTLSSPPLNIVFAIEDQLDYRHVVPFSYQSCSNFEHISL